MTSALLFILGIALIFGIARYNNSNKLFWSLLISYILSFTAAKVIIDAFGENKRSDDTTLNQAYPIQGLDAASDTCLCLLAGELLSTDVKVTSKPVGQVIAPEYIECNLASSDVFGVTQGLYLHILPNPPNSTIMFDTS